MSTFDLATQSVRELNAQLHQSGSGEITVVNPGGRHSVAVGAVDSHTVTIEGNVGYYCAGMNTSADIIINGHAGPGLAENMISGTVTVSGNASQYCAATAHGGLIVIKGDASSRCGISMKGVNIVVNGNVGHMSAFMAQKGTLVVCGDAGDALGDSIYEADLFVAGSVGSLGADCEEKAMDEQARELLGQLLEQSRSNQPLKSFKRYGSARQLYHFNVDNAASY